MLFHIVIIDQRERVQTLAELKERYLIKEPFCKYSALGEADIIAFAVAHPFLKLQVQAIGAPTKNPAHKI